MAIYRTIQLSFWTDNKVVDDFTPEDKYFYLYLFTNPQTNLCGCYEVSLKTMSEQMGYNKDTVERLLERFEAVHQVIRYSFKTKEVLLLNWHRYNWQGGNQIKCISNEIDSIKNVEFRNILINLFNGKFEEKKPLISPLQANCLQATVTVTDNNTDYSSLSNNRNNKSNKSNKNILFPDNEELQNAFDDFLKMRDKIKKPMTDRAIKLAVNKLNKLSNGDDDLAIQIIEQSILNCWQNLYELKQDNNRNNSGGIDWSKV